jgi:hypothetical protein
MLPPVFGKRMIRKIHGPKMYRVWNGGFQIIRGFVIYTGYISCVVVFVVAVVKLKGYSNRLHM